ncbi:MULTISPECIES: aldehyde dehydrogenase family protein [Roseobacteraceae]|uniref:aldehyde dehydrogenase family protein n=1 Tax=Roseobacteraceae TaxID=2854170 RepID=UPI000B7A65A5|nr:MULTISPECIES: aldehyde dehydrogenase family protein [Roseobacteraceae]
MTTPQLDALKIGHALHDDMQIGPVASASQLENNMSYVAPAAKEGCDVLAGDDTQAPNQPSKSVERRPKR